MQMWKLDPDSNQSICEMHEWGMETSSQSLFSVNHNDNSRDFPWRILTRKLILFVSQNTSTQNIANFKTN